MLLSRRDLLRSTAIGFPYLAAQALLAADNPQSAIRNPQSNKPHFPARAKRVLFLFMKGGPSQVDTFDYKPLLQRDDGKPLPFAKPRVQFAPTGNLLASPFRFAQYGQSGAWVSELFPHLARWVDRICFIMRLHGSNDATG